MLLRIRVALAMVTFAVLTSQLSAQGQLGEPNKWIPISASVLAQVKPGYPGKTAGVTVDPATGDVFMVVPDNGIWKSTDQGETFDRVDNQQGEKKIGGRCETGYALNFDPAGKRLMCFMIYGSSALTTDGGKSWTASKTSHLDFGAVDWHDTGKVFLALRHEAGGMLTLSTDAGATWKDLQKGFSHVGVVSDKILLTCKEKSKGIVRSTDGGETWTEVSSLTPSARVMIVRDKTCYWASSQGLLTSTDHGQTWSVAGSAQACVFGPYFGRSADHLVVVGKEGFFESRDAGKSWQQVAPLPEGFTVGLVGHNYAWDAERDIFYASSMGKDTFRFVRKK